MAKDPREYGYEGDMVISQLKSIMANAEKLMSMLKPETDLPEWVQLKITLAQDYVLTARDYMESEMKEGVDDKFASTSYSTTRGKIVKTKSGSFIATNKSGSTKSFDDMNAAKKHADSGVDDVNEAKKGQGRGIVHRHLEVKNKVKDPYDRKSKSKEDDDPAGHMHPMIQMSRIASAGDGKEPHFQHEDGTKSKISRHLARNILSTHNSMRTTQEKDNFAKKIHANRDSLNNAIKINEACWSGYVARGMKNKGGRMVPNCVPAEAVTTEKPPFEGPYKKVDKKQPVTRSHLKSLTKAARDTISKSANKKSK